MGDTEKIRGAAADAGRVDSKSAAAAALTVGAGQVAETSPKPRRTARAVAWCVAAVSAVLIGFSAWAIASSGYFGPSGASSAASDSQSAIGLDAAKGESADSAESADDAKADASSEAGVSGDGGEDDGGASASSRDDEGGRSDSSSESGSDSNSGHAAGNASGSPAGSGGSSGSGGAAGAGSGSGEQASLITVTVVVDSSNVGSPVSYSQKLSFEAGSKATVYDALVGTGLAVDSSYSGGFGSVYVSSIGGLAEKASGHPGSGWKYFVDGSEPNVGCNQYELHDGASIVWKYVLSVGEGL